MLDPLAVEFDFHSDPWYGALAWCGLCFKVTGSTAPSRLACSTTDASIFRMPSCNGDFAWHDAVYHITSRFRADRCDVEASFHVAKSSVKNTLHVGCRWVSLPVCWQKLRSERRRRNLKRNREMWPPSLIKNSGQEPVTPMVLHTGMSNSHITSLENAKAGYRPGIQNQVAVISR